MTRYKIGGPCTSSEGRGAGVEERRRDRDRERERAHPERGTKMTEGRGKGEKKLTKQQPDGARSSHMGEGSSEGRVGTNRRTLDLFVTHTTPRRFAADLGVGRG